MSKLYECTFIMKYYAQANDEKEARALLPKVLETEQHQWADHAIPLRSRDVFISEQDKNDYPVYTGSGATASLGEAVAALPDKLDLSKYDTWY